VPQPVPPYPGGQTMSDAHAALARLEAVLRGHASLAIAVSGGVDSMTLAHVAARTIDVTVVHAVSPAVPAEATQRVRDHARKSGWSLTETDAGEFADPRYVSNPIDRCYFCKSNLYDRIAGLTDRPIASGANLDDLGDFRPGLTAARERRVVHPLIEAAIDKASVRQIASLLGLDDLCELPAQPCLASRVETGIAISADDLAFAGDMERALRKLAPEMINVRCRIMRNGVVVEVDDPAGPSRAGIEEYARRTAERAGRGFAGVLPYRRGSAFVAS
jgi:pyridinium-3,5-biscarboxylic acid mononucleotide sulfurtransferase